MNEASVSAPQHHDESQESARFDEPSAVAVARQAPDFSRRLEAGVTAENHLRQPLENDGLPMMQGHAYRQVRGAAVKYTNGAKAVSATARPRGTTMVPHLFDRRH